MRQKDVAMGHGTVHFTSNTGTTYKVELSGGKIISVIDGRDNTYDATEIQKYWNKGFPLVGAIAATIGDDDSSASEDERQMLYPPEELQETNDGSPNTTGKFAIKVTSVIPSLGNKRSSWYHKNSDGAVVRYNTSKEVESAIEGMKQSRGKGMASFDRGYTSYQVGHLKENTTVVKESPGVIGKNEKSPPGFPRVIYEKLVIKFKGDKDKINEVMWKLHNGYGDKLKAVSGLVKEDTIEPKK